MKVLRGLILGALIVPAVAIAALDATVGTTINKVASFNAGYGNGDVTFQVANPTSACAGGYWMNKADVGYANSLAVQLLAQQSKALVVVNGHNDQIWAGSHAPYCKLYSISIK